MLELGSPNWLVAAGFAALGAAFVGALRRHMAGRAAWRYDTRAAWLRACAYFSFAWALAAAAGTLSTLLDNPLVFPGQASDRAWVVSTIVVVAVVIVGYWVVWPMGTLAHGRKLVIPDTVVFGLLWGVSEGLVYATVWLTAHRIFADVWAGGVWTVLVVITVMAVFSGVGHAVYWDVHVSPDHNVIDWNTRKVLLVHNPNLILCTVYVTVFENLAIFVLLETLALLGSTVMMPFPTFRRPHPPDPLVPALGPPTDVPADMTGRTVVITGGAGGIGSVVTRRLAQQGARVVIVDIDAEKADEVRRDVTREAGDGQVEVLVGDLSTNDGTGRIAAVLLGSCPRIDLLVNNAGVFLPAYTENDAGVEMSLAVNHLGAFLLTQLLLDRLVASSARVLFVSSDAHRQAPGIDFDDINAVGAWKGRDVSSTAASAAYHRSKLALTLTAMELAERTRGTAMTVNVITPGALVVTPMYDDVTGPFAWFVAVMKPLLRPRGKAARIYTYVGTSPEVEGVTGWYWKDNRPVKESAVARDPELRARMWDWSMQAAGLEAAASPVAEATARAARPSIDLREERQP